MPLTDRTAEIQLNDPQTLYRRWEEQQWSPFEIDLSRDREQWPQMSEDDQRLIYWALCSLVVAEERITTKFSGLVAAYGTEEEATFLATQQVDEARHMQFYARFRDEVIDSPAEIAAHVESAREQVSPAFRRIFDEALVEAHEALVAAPANLAAKVRVVTIYHLILESTLGLTSFRFITRHIGYGVWFLREAARAHDGAGQVIRDTLAELLPVMAETLTPPDRDGDTDWDALGAGADEIREFALGGLTRRLEIIGTPL